MDKTKTKMKKIGRIVLDALLYLFLAICVFAVFVTLFSAKDTDGAANLFGYQLRVVTSDSMAKCELTDVSDFDIKSIPLRSLLFIKTVPEDEEKAAEFYEDLEVGDVLTFRYVYVTQVTITHRITAINENKETGGYTIELAGDNKSSESSQLYQIIDTSQTDSPNYVIGKVTGQAKLLGFLLSLLKSAVGIIFIVIVPCFIIIILEVLKIVGVVNADKKKKAAEIAAAKDEELEELRRRLALLEARADAPPDGEEPKND